jgi:hypothetical protein
MAGRQGMAFLMKRLQSIGCIHASHWNPATRSSCSMAAIQTWSCLVRFAQLSCVAARHPIEHVCVLTML